MTKHRCCIIDRPIHPIEEDHVEVNVQVQRRAKALDQRHGAGVAGGSGEACLLQQEAGNRAPDGVQYQRQRSGISSQQESQRKGQRQHPLAQRTRGQHLISEQRCRLGHAPTAARGTKAALLAAECYELLAMAVLAAHAQKALVQSAALQVGVKLLLHIGG